MPALSDRIRAEAFPALAQGWRWWTCELAQLVPGRMAWGRSRARRADIRPSRDGVEIVRVAAGEGERLSEARPLAAFDDGNWQELTALLEGHRVRLLLAPPLVHILTLTLPKAARPYLRTAIPLQLAEHAPLPPGQLAWAAIDTRLQGEKLSIRIAMARIDLLDAIEAGFREHDIAVPPILAEMPDGKTVALRRAARSPIDLSRPWTWAIGTLVSTPFLVLLALQLLVVHERDKVADLANLARPKLAAERHIRAQAEVAHGLNQLYALPAVTSQIEHLADHLPPSAHAIELSGHDDGTIDISLATSNADAARTALIGTLRLTGVRQVSVTQAPDGSSIVQYEAHVR